MADVKLFSEMREQSTWKLFFLTILTFGIYAAHYMSRQTRRINSRLDEEDRISEGFIIAILVLTYFSAILVIFYFFVPDGHPVEKLSDFSDRICNILFLVWAFKARNRMNMINKFSPDEHEWFHGLWTFLFSAVYFNYHVNVIADADNPEISQEHE